MRPSAARHAAPRPWSVARALVFSKLRRRLGLDRARICLVSAAPVTRDTLDFFLSLDIAVLELYGMSECTGPATASLPGAHRTGWAGRALPGTELRIAEDGEILIRGPHVFLGYFQDEPVDARGARPRRMAALRRRGRDRCGGIPSGDRPQEGAARHVGRQEDGPRHPREPPQAASRRRAGGGGGRRTQLPGRLADPRPPSAWPRPPPKREARPATWEALRPVPCSGAPRAGARGANAQFARFETIKRFAVLPSSSAWTEAS